MRAKVCIGLVAGLFFTTSFVKADTFYVRNQPFKQVIQSGSQAYVSLEGFLTAVGLNWDSNGKVVTITTSPASNPPLANGQLTLKYGEDQVELDATNRGDATYVSLRPLAHLLGYNVMSNSQTGIVDIVKAHLATAKDKQMLAAAEQAKVDREKAVSEAWAKKAAEIKAKREEAAAAANATTGNSTASNSTSSNNADATSNPTTSKSTGKTAANTTVAASGTASSPSAASNTTAEKPVVKQPRLEVIRTDANPDYSTGAVTITVQVKNDGEGVAKSVSGRLIVTGPSGAAGAGVSPSAPVLAGATNTGTVPDSSVGTSEWLNQYVSGPALQPDGSWNYETVYRHPAGSSMPHGQITVNLKLDPVKN